MVFGTHSYSVLLVSASEKFNKTFRSLLDDQEFPKVRLVNNVATARSLALEGSFDFVIVNTPLPDDFGVRLAIDLCSGKNTVALLFVKTELHEQVRSEVLPFGIFTLPKPTSEKRIEIALQWMAAARERLRRTEKKTLSLEQKMEEIRFVNRAKWLLIEKKGMAEADAHRFIEKQAMDRCLTRREIADAIIRELSNT